ncbi:hypothetical protein GLOTRDRAFT_134276 [Gloeophyllum trabeum ATCC 11539]|uniref:Uncharacterized protein n=1 Tax=Gloeophyllum trabeum (strain ATCC 11539 / FP-39264 / Madison 617) TaxID=670483 RepID=S7PRS0_GLOTA|nr:uncharacterized protein GLOTRDRAFT_134276 [Gloeophyllum trabeum ATCC 11539]EPQ50078.1 hypothetical protein GLOTRDRAFT_134276 [Gloeophyllum trabeum ATCC 11539]
MSDQSSAQQPSFLSDVFKLPLPDLPEMRSAKTSSSTKGPTDAQRTMLERKQLRWVIYDEDLAERVAQKADAIAAKVEIDERDDTLRTSWRGRVYPPHTSTLLTRMVNSEEDAREWIHQVLVHPALACVRATRGNGIGGIVGEQLYIASSPAEEAKAIADGLFYTDRFSKKRFDKIQKNPYIADGALSNAGKRAARFLWPGPDAERIHHDTKLLVQVWTEMLDNNVQHAVLTSYETTLFFYRPLEDLNTLFMSKSYRIEAGMQNDPTLRAIYAWMLSALGSLDVELPRVDADWKTRLTTYLKEHPEEDTVRHGVDVGSVESVGEGLRTAQARHETGTGRDTRSITSYRDRLQMYADPPVPHGAAPGEDEAPSERSSTTGRTTPHPPPPSPDTTPKASRVLPRSAPSAHEPPRSMVPPDDRQEGSSRSGRHHAAQRGTRGSGASRGRQGGRKGGDVL